jgi:hypothetical protein
MIHVCRGTSVARLLVSGALPAGRRDALTRLAADLVKAESLDGSAVRAALDHPSLTEP